ncbi:hypothetical protein [Maribacter hydrothermalis]|uniref:Uncharacterized protein n=1 Tax=Maribacter hydrothermalis TaxID=1836467 RepID=A0A1B7Z1I3_9FLAO|nr:hypothetical protein [Maribacter hydrothermalis]APQ18065.1 hypothetical protein BTR34_12330 [Maribacter hydrothermalis]OBR36410.1 hypothetical protein A9200_08220 [Maribacter hydrothermalis]
MKSILIVLFVAITSFTTTYGQNTETMNGTYEGYIDEMYVFTDSDGYRAEFTNVSNEISTKFELTSDTYVGRQFMITFTVDTELDEDEEEIQISTIVNLEMPE